MMKLILENVVAYSWPSSDGWALLDLALLVRDSSAMAFLISRGLRLSPTRAKMSPCPDESHSSKEPLAISASKQLIHPSS